MNSGNPFAPLFAIVCIGIAFWGILESSCNSYDLPYCDLQVQPAQQQEATK